MSHTDAVYFDHNATTPVDPRVLEAMLPWLAADHGNPSSVHAFGRRSRAALEEARRQVAALLAASPEEIVFTSSGTEANNAVIFDAARRAAYRGHFVLSAFEHPSVEGTVARLEQAGMTATRVRPGVDGVVAAESVVEALRPETVLVCLMLANNELGTLQPVAEVAAECRRRGVPVLCDAVQAVGKVAVQVESLGVDYLTLGGHKFHGPLGAAALWLRTGAAFESWLVGASQESGRRPSTENVPALVGLGTAAQLAAEELPDRRRHLAALRSRLETGLAGLPDTRLHGDSAPRLPHTTNVALLGVRAQALVPALDAEGFAVSAGAACGSGRAKPSPTLRALGLDEEEALSSLRISFGMTNRLEEVEAFLAVLPRVISQLRTAFAVG